ncbi:hypothetical protein MNBD_NITROSPINAE02-1981 [hydrothermal vent metagenome]|uniref:HDOD domain-containing protein n=1 Tax=hydrothermal vent metagenome TaxID=652676 RepID=A0A3B1CKK7_9ZZZZ
MEKEKKRIFIQKIQSLPTLPTALAKIVSVAENESSTADDLADVISKDQSISSTILRLVNSAFYGHLRQISSINHSIVILGFRTVKTMALGVSIFQSTSNPKRQSFNRTKFWTHSIGVATFAKRIAGKTKSGSGIDQEALFLSGLLHDLGKVVFDNYFNEEYEVVTKEALEKNEWIGDVEMRLLGMNHSEAGDYLAQKWQFPPAVIESIRHHHNVDEAHKGNGGMAAITHLADYCCRKMKLGSGGDNEEVALNPLALETCGVTEEILDELIAEVEADRDSIEAFAID